MELYQTFTTIQETVWTFSPVWTLEIFLACVISALVVWASLFILQGFGVAKMAKNRAIKHKWLAFIPFVNLMYIGKLVGVCTVFGRPMKRAGVYAMIAQILSTLVSLTALSIFAYLCFVEGVPQRDQWGDWYWDGLDGASGVLFKIANVSFYLLPILQLIYTIFIAILSFALYREYSPKNYFILGLVTIFIPISRYVIVFTLRNKEHINFEEYMRKKHEEFIRQQQQYGGYNPYGTPYRNPYANQYGQSRQQDESPFSDFSNDAEKTPDPNDPDGFFD